MMTPMPVVTVNSLIHPLYQDFNLRNASFMFLRHTKENAFSPLGVTGKLDFLKVALNAQVTGFLVISIRVVHFASLVR